MRSILVFTCSVLCIGSAFAANSALLAKVKSGELKEAKASWWGFNAEGDNTESLQIAIKSGVPRLIIDKQASPWITEMLHAVSNQEIVLEEGVVLLAKRGSFQAIGDSLLNMIGVSNVVVRGYGATLRMWRSDYDAPPYKKAEWRHVINMQGSSNIKILGVTLAESGGDGIYLGGRLNKDIVIKDVICDKNYRQGISVISAENLLIENTIMSNTAGTPPEAGIDFEPNTPKQKVKNCVMRNCITENNRGVGFLFALVFQKASSEPVSVILENCRSKNDRNGFYLVGGNSESDAVKGSCKVVGCSFEKSRSTGIVLRRNSILGHSIDFKDCKVVECAPDKTSVSDVEISSSGDDFVPMGNMRFDNLLVRQSIARPWIDVGSASDSEQLVNFNGSVTLVQPGTQNDQIVQEHITLDNSWVQQNFPPRFPVYVKAVKPMMERARLVDNTENMQKLAPLRCRHWANYVFYGKANTKVVFTGVQVPIRKLKQLKPLAIIKPYQGEDTLKRIPLATESQAIDTIEFTPEISGFYKLDVNLGSGGNSFILREANVAVAFEATDKSVRLIRSSGTVYAYVPKSTERFAFCFAGEGRGERLKASVFNPAGKQCWSQDEIAAAERYTVANPGESDFGLWALKIEPATKAYFEDYTIRVLGIPAFIFLNKERYWEF